MEKQTSFSTQCLQLTIVDDFAFVNGTIKYSVDEDQTIIPCYVVIVDDNSGSMDNGIRKVACANKTRVIIEACEAAGVKYCYATFGTKSTIHGACPPSAIKGILRCNEGTMLECLANAALKSAEVLCRDIHSNDTFRFVFILNTDGEASDGVSAGQIFVSGYESLQKRFPNMTEARTFVLGIGSSHDQKVLAAMSVGESTYFNYPDEIADDMSKDAEERIFPELSGGYKKVKVALSNNVIEVAVKKGLIDFCQVACPPEERSLTLPNGEVVVLQPEFVSRDDSRYFELKLQNLKDQTLNLASSIKEALLTRTEGTVGFLESQFKKIVDELANLVDKDAAAQLKQASFMDELTHRTDANWKQRAYQQLRKSLKVKRAQATDRKSAVRQVLDLCERGIHTLKIGSTLSAEVERDYMEVLGSGGFSHWTTKKKDKVLNRALGQSNQDSITNADEQVSQLIQKFSNANNNLSTSDESLEVDQSCWFSMMRGSELAEDGDILCIVGYVPHGARNLPLCSVSSAKVLHNSILKNKVKVCHYPMSFLALREILLNKKQINRGPDGVTINACFCLLPSPNHSLSLEIGKAYLPLCMSQLLTSRWTYTVGTGEYRNGLVASLMAIIANGESDADLNLLQRAISSFYRLNVGNHSLTEMLSRAYNFTKGYCTSGEVSTFLVAVMDQLLSLHHQNVKDEFPNAPSLPQSVKPDAQFWRVLFLRILRDKMGSIFKSYANVNDDDAMQQVRQKEIDAETIVEIIVQGLNDDQFGRPGSFQFVAPVPEDTQKETTEVRNQVEVEISDFFEEAPLEDLNSQSLPGCPVRTAWDPASTPAVHDVDINEAEETVDEAHQIESNERFETLLPELLKAFRLYPRRSPENGCLLPNDMLNALQDATRVRIVKAVLQSVESEINLMIRSAKFAEYIETMGNSSKGVTNLMALLELEENDVESFQWILKQVALAIELRQNSLFRSNQFDVERSPVDYFISLNSKYTHAQTEEWKAAETIRKRNVKDKTQRFYLSHEKNLASCPLKIRDQEHAALISEWTKQHHGFVVEMTTSPIDDSLTGMAKNTFLTPLSPYFMKKVDPYNVIRSIYGTNEDRETNSYATHFHTVARRFFNEVQTEQLGDQFNSFDSKLRAQYPTSGKYSTEIGISLWIAFRFEKDGILDSTINSIKKQIPLNDTSLQMIEKETLWESNPSQFLDDYFAVDRSKDKLTKDEFLAYAKEKLGEEYDPQITEEVFESFEI